MTDNIAGVEIAGLDDDRLKIGGLENEGLENDRLEFNCVSRCLATGNSRAKLQLLRKLCYFFVEITTLLIFTQKMTPEHKNCTNKYFIA